MAKYPYVFAAKALIADLGGIEGLRKILEGQGIDVNTKTIQKWRERDSFPSWAVASLFIYFDRKKSMKALINYIKVGSVEERKVTNDQRDCEDAAA